MVLCNMFTVLLSCGCIPVGQEFICWYIFMAMNNFLTPSREATFCGLPSCAWQIGVMRMKKVPERWVIIHTFTNIIPEGWKSIHSKRSPNSQPSYQPALLSAEIFVVRHGNNYIYSSVTIQQTWLAMLDLDKVQVTDRHSILWHLSLVVILWSHFLGLKAKEKCVRQINKRALLSHC
jgi:hypothetical protein